MDERLDEARVLTLLERRHPAPAWAFLRAVRDGTGMFGCRTSDGIAMSLWPSRGLELHGFEVKCHRSDWLRELKNPRKAEVIAGYCDRWWLVAGASDVVQDVGEVPPDWGLIVAKKTPKMGWHLATVKKAEKRKAEAIDRIFLAAIFRRTWEEFLARRKGMIDRSDIADEIEKAEREGAERARSTVGMELRSAEKFRRAVTTFEEQTGIKFDVWSPEWPIEVFKTAEEIVRTRRQLDNSLRRAIDDLDRAKTAAEEAAKALAKSSDQENTEREGVR